MQTLTSKHSTLKESFLFAPQGYIGVYNTAGVEAETAPSKYASTSDGVLGTVPAISPNANCYVHFYSYPYIPVALADPRLLRRLLLVSHVV